MSMKDKIEKIEILSPLEFKKASKLIKEAKENAKYEYGCIMARVDQQVQRPGLNVAHLYKPEDDRYGIESEQHVTLLYGTLPSVKEEDVLSFLKLIKMPTIFLTGISLFSNLEFDVVKYDVDCKELHLLNNLCKLQFEYFSTFPTYIPHLTIAYMLPGTGAEYIRTFDEPIPLQISAWTYSQADGRKIEVDNKGKIVLLRDSRIETTS